MTIPFSGSYRPDDVQFLLTPTAIPNTPVQQKEALIQSGAKHYSQLLSYETAPPADYLTLFQQAMQLNQQRMAEHLLYLAQRIIASRPQGITLVSLARAGTPLGVLLKHVLQRHFQTTAAHYSISILRDVGIDNQALRYILQRHSPESLVFVDGWSSKGSIAGQLTDSLDDFARSDGVDIARELYVLTDLSGSATVAAASDDYLIPSCILNATVTGLISRSFYDSALLPAGAFHGCVYYAEFAQNDRSRYFIDSVLDTVAQLCQRNRPECPDPQLNRLQLQAAMQVQLREISEQYSVNQTKYIKVGICEATRVLLRREARLLLLQNANDPSVQHCHWLAAAKSIPTIICPKLPYRAAALIQEHSL